jgi:hypothetical protein
MEAGSSKPDVPGRLARLEQDIELLAQHVACLEPRLAAAVDGVRSDAEIALLEQAAKWERRARALEALLAERAFSDDLAERLAAARSNG